MQPDPEPLARDELFVSLLARDHSRLMGYLLTLVAHRQDAEDLFQKVSVTLWTKFDEFESDRDFFAWASRIAFFTACNHRRAQHRRRMIFNPELLELFAQERPVHLEQQGSRLDALLRCVEKLRGEDRTLLFRAYTQNFTIKELAVESGRAVQTLYNRLAGLKRDLVLCVRRKLVAPQA